MTSIGRRAAAALAMAAFAGAALAAPIVFDGDRSGFFAATSATQASAAYPSLITAGPFVSGSVTFARGPGATNIDFSEFTARLTGNDLALSGVEDLDVAFAQPVIAFGFEFVEPEFDPNVNATFAESTFSITLFRLGVQVGSFSLSAPNDVAHFWGVQNDVLFDAVQIRETAGGIDNEFFGQFFTALRIAPPGQLPEPHPLLLLGTAMALVSLYARRRRR
jgi:hypothetical protein